MPDPTAEEVKAAKRLIAQANIAKARAKKEAKKAARQSPTPAASTTTTPTPAEAVTYSAPTVVERFPATETVGAIDPDPDGEMAFIDNALGRALAEAESGKVKYLYQKTVSAVMARRVLREIMSAQAPGAPFPQWVALRRNDSTGEREKDPNEAPATLRVLQAADAPLRPPPPPPAPIVVPRRAAPVTAVASAAPRPEDRPASDNSPSGADILRQVTGGVPQINVGSTISHPIV